MRQILSFVTFPRVQLAMLAGYIAYGDTSIALARVLPDLRRLIWATYERPILERWQSQLARFIG
ncbi:MAG: hypothetical protein COX82_04350 [Candidatus Magasanikbacteria bacterium CG_4_10_14_0_2_um_filter_41_10]|uniref:Uncharacterized protein n=1 Tax=Candidatus Magasanikbacteria bacterium CG_4_10_14_0_2_um_filter_41_10 TaxID=1974638 RepID=A0A2M7V2J3_9BACT|nr:MAG: hypothetical protein COX82_04350 [Candidatus Magasanikbacteria bacterium CG_4_10_14_0_2_um_filter_41_10]